MRGRREGLSGVMLAILLLACMTIQGGVGIVKASPGKATVSVDPPIIEKAPPNSFDINIKVTDIIITPGKCQGLYNWGFKLEFNASILQVLDVTRGWFLEQAGLTMWQHYDDLGYPYPMVIDNINGFVSVGDLLWLDPELPEVGATGSGPLATITFQIKAQGTSLLHLKDTTLETILYGTTTNPIDHEAFDGFFEYPPRKHDIAVTHVTASPTSVPVGDRVSINATVKNEGEVAETFKVKAYYNWTEPEWSEIGTITVTDLAPDDSETVSFSWKPTKTYKGTHIIKAGVPSIPGEKVEDTADNTKKFDGKVFVGEAPEASFSYLPIPPIAGTNVTFDASASEDPDGTIVSYAWDFGDDTNDTVADPVINHNYTAPSKYNVTLTVTDNHGFTSTTSKNVTVKVHDVAVTSVTVSHIAVMPGEPVTISVTVVNKGNFTETFNVTTYYDDTLIATNTSCWETPLKHNETRTLAFTWNTTGVSLGTYTIKAVASTVTDEINTTNNELIDGTVTIATVNIFDCSVEVGGVTFHVVTESNSTVSKDTFEFIRADKKISFNVTGPDGTVGFCNVTIPKVLLGGPYTVFVDSLDKTPSDPPSNDTHSFIYFTYDLSTCKVEIKGATVATPPVAIFTPSTTSAYVGDSITFDASDSDDPDGTIVSYEWDFGDETPIVTETDPTTTHVYSSADNYTVTLTVTDDDDLTDIATTNMTILWVHDVAVANLTVSPNTVKIGEPVYINVTVANEGDLTESFTVKVYYDSRVLKIWHPSQVVVASHENTTLTTTWYTTGVAAGEYIIKANATLDGDNNPGNNELIYGTVTLLLSSTISISASPTTMTLGENTTITGSITPERTGVTVTIQYRPAGGSWSELTTVPTDLLSQYSYVWTPTTLGTYELKASWEGDATTSEATSNVITIELVEIQDITLDVGGVSFHVVTESNSTVSNLELIQADKKISFNVTGPAGTVGYCNVTIPKDLLDALPDQWTVLVDGEPTTPLVTHNATHTSIYFTYTLSTHKVEIIGATIATPPVAIFTPSTTGAYVGDLITFDASASYDEDGAIDSWDWDFDGDGVIDATGEIVEHAYSSAGNYTVTLTATDDDGLTDIATDTVTITVQEAPALSILLYVAAAGVAAIIIVAIAFYFLRARKQDVKDILETGKSSKGGQQNVERKVHKRGLSSITNDYFRE